MSFHVTETSQDRISNLSGDIIDRILLLLPIKDSVKMSVLSTKWRNKWETVPSLVLNNQSLPPVVDGNGIAMIDKLVMDIYRVLLLHSGPIHKFELSYIQNLPDGEIDKWIRYLSKHSPSDLEILNGEVYKMPSCMFSWQNLTSLVLLTECVLRPPSTFKGFKHLKTLQLRNVTMAQDVLECLISNSPVLEKLVLISPNGFDKLNIDAPNLQFFHLQATFVDIGLKCTNLAQFSMIFYCSDFNRNVRLSNHGNLVKLMAGIPQIETLIINPFSTKYLAVGYIPTELVLPCSNLHHLKIFLDLTSLNEISVLLCILRSAPNLQKLQVGFLEVNMETSAEVWETDSWNRPFSSLRCVTLYFFAGAKDEMDFIKFMLLTAPVLEKMVVKLSEEIDDNRKMFEIVRQVCRFNRASPLAEIDVLDPELFS